MNESANLLIRGGTIVDGRGGETFEADVSVVDGKIQAVGSNLPRGAEEIDARGKLVTPGFIDLHTHYDAQVTWSNRITPSSWNGVTTAMIGNCGVGFAPCLPHQRDMLVKLMEGVEDIPEVVLNEGLPWNWESFEEYLSTLASKQFDLDVATQVPHAALRVFVMGQRGADREPATPQDCAKMAQLAAAGVRAGAMGFSTSRTLNHQTKDGRAIPTLKAAEDELTAVADALREVGAGWMQVISDFDDSDAEFALLRRVAQRSGRPMSITILQRDRNPEWWRTIMQQIGAANAQGTQIVGQVLTRPTGVLLGFEISQNPFLGRSSWTEIAHLPLAEKVAILRRPDFRARLLSEVNPSDKLRDRVERWARIFPLGDPPNYEPSAEQSVAAIAERSGRDPAEVAYDLLLENDGKTILYRPQSNYSYCNLDTVHDMIAHPDTLVGLGDGGAHVGVLCDASAFSYMLTHWTRDRTRGDKFELPWAVKRLTYDNAQAIGLHDRGELRAGMKADINVIDYDAMQLTHPEVVYDLPGGGRRLIQKTKGYVATIVAGVPVYRDGESTGQLPGRAIRGAKPAP
jgi:N-acyl-D-aspartate/D-glutamate deacylase